MTNKEKINYFIENFKTRNGDKSWKTIEDFFLEGCCFWFAQILKARFPFGKILYDLKNNHFVFYGGDDLNIEKNGIFDIRGEVTNAYLPRILNGSVVEWSKYEDFSHKKRLWRDCIAFTETEPEINFDLLL